MTQPLDVHVIREAVDLDAEQHLDEGDGKFVTRRPDLNSHIRAPPPDTSTVQDLVQQAL
ncbi:MAG: hypothetical protein ABJB98_06975 [Actinomycetota bacterium]